MKPTPAQLKAEILTGPRQGECAAPWAAGADGTVADLLNDRTLGQTRPVPPTLSLTAALGSGSFSAASVAGVFNHNRFPDFNDAINKQDGPGALAMAGLFKALGVITAAELAAFTTYVASTVATACSAAEAKGWDAVQHLDVAQARKS